MGGILELADGSMIFKINGYLTVYFKYPAVRDIIIRFFRNVSKYFEMFFKIQLPANSEIEKTLGGNAE